MSREITHQFLTGEFDPGMMLTRERDRDKEKAAEEAELARATAVKVPKTKQIDVEKYEEHLQQAIAFLKDRKKEQQKRDAIRAQNAARALEPADQKLPKRVRRESLGYLSNVKEMTKTITAAIDSLDPECTSTVSETI